MLVTTTVAMLVLLPSRVDGFSVVSTTMTGARSRKTTTTATAFALKMSSSLSVDETTPTMPTAATATSQPMTPTGIIAMVVGNDETAGTSTTAHDEMSYHQFIDHAHEVAFSDVPLVTRQEYETVLRGILHLQSDCATGTIACVDLCENQAEVAAIVAALRVKMTMGTEHASAVATSASTVVQSAGAATPAAGAGSSATIAQHRR